MSWKNWAAAAVFSLQLPAITFAKPADLPIDQRINYAGCADGVPASPAPVAVAPPNSRAADVFERAERSRQQGQTREARRGYEETHLLAPTSRVGRQAIERLGDLDRPGNGFAEEQEPPLNRTSFRFNLPPRGPMNHVKPTAQEYRDMLRMTRPLGTVPSETRRY